MLNHCTSCGVVKVTMRERKLKDRQVHADYQVLEGARAYEELSLTELRNNGYRITMPRVQVIRALADTDVALSAYAIHEKIINAGGKIDVVSVYRILTTLHEIGLIHHVGIVDGYFPRRDTNPSDKHTEVVVFSESKEVRELQIPGQVVELIQKQAAAEGFELASIKLELSAGKAKGKK